MLTPVPKQIKRLSVHITDDTIVDLMKSSKQTSQLFNVTMDDININTIKLKKQPSKHARFNSIPNNNDNNDDGNNASKKKFKKKSKIKHIIQYSRSKSEKLFGSNKPTKAPKNVKRFVRWIGNNFTYQKKKTMMMSDIGWKPTLKEIMNDKQLFNSFLEYCRLKYVEENLLFLEQIKKLNCKIDMLRIDKMKGTIMMEQMRASFSTSVEVTNTNNNIMPKQTQFNHEPSSTVSSIYTILDKIEESKRKDAIYASEPRIDTQGFVFLNGNGIGNKTYPYNNEFKIDSDYDDDTDFEDYNDISTVMLDNLFSSDDRQDIQNQIDCRIQKIYDEYIGNDAPNQVNISHTALTTLNEKRKTFRLLTLFEKSQLFSRANIEIERLLKLNVLHDYYYSTQFLMIAQSRPNKFNPNDYKKLYDTKSINPNENKSNNNDNDINIDINNDSNNDDPSVDIIENIDYNTSSKISELNSHLSSMRISVSTHGFTNINDINKPVKAISIAHSDTTEVSNEDSTCATDECNEYKFDLQMDNAVDSLNVPQSKSENAAKKKLKKSFHVGANSQAVPRTKRMKKKDIKKSSTHWPVRMSRKKRKKNKNQKKHNHHSNKKQHRHHKPHVLAG